MTSNGFKTASIGMVDSLFYNRCEGSIGLLVRAVPLIKPPMTPKHVGPMKKPHVLADNRSGLQEVYCQAVRQKRSLD